MDDDNKRFDFIYQKDWKKAKIQRLNIRERIV
jgi:hypothetical protein